MNPSLRSGCAINADVEVLRDPGKSVIVIERHQGVMSTPTGSSISVLVPVTNGGRIVFEGAPADLVAARSTLTGEHLAA